jgi:signal transduction histidine kinase
VVNRLRSLLAEPRAVPPPPRRLRRDWVLLTAVVVAALLEGLLRADLPLRVVSMVLCIGLAPTLLWRRTRPLTMVALAFGASAVVDLGVVLTDARAPDMVTMIYVLLLPYALFRWASGREVAIGLAVILAAAAMGFVASWTGVGDLVGGMAVLLSSMMAGVVARTQHGARERRLEQAKTQERVELARELHDTVAHHVSAIAIQAQAGRAVAATSPSTSVEALTVIEAEATRALAEMRAMVRMLRNQQPADYSPRSGVPDLERLAGTTSTGTRVDVTLSGDIGRLTAAVDAAAFRIAREAVTNALKHARNASLVDVHVNANGRSVHVSVRDDGDPVASPPATASGFGLTGMTERATLLGGTCHAGPCPDRGWAVDATIPQEAVR